MRRCTRLSGESWSPTFEYCYVCRGGIGNHEREVLIQGIGVTRDAISSDVCCLNSDDDTASYARGNENAFHVIASICRSASNRIGAGENIAFVGVAADSNFKVEVIDKSVSRSWSRRISPRERDPYRRSCAVDGTGENSLLTGCGELVSSNLITSYASWKEIKEIIYVSLT